MSWQNDVYVTGANPPPGRTIPVESGWGHSGSRADGGVGINVYVAGGAGPLGAIPVSQTNPAQISLSGVSIGGVIEVTSTAGNPVLVTGSVYVLNPGSGGTSGAITASITGVVAVSQTNRPESQAVLQGGGLAVLASGTVGVVQSGALSAQVSGNVSASVSGVVGVTQSGALAALVSGVVGVAQSGGFIVQVSGAAGSPVFVATTGSVPVNTGTMPVVVVTSSQGSPVWVAITGALSAVFSGAQAVTSTVASPVFVTGTVHVDNPSGGGGGGGTVTQGGPWSALVSGAVGVLQSGALAASVSGSVTASISGNVGVVQSGALGAQVSGVVGITQSGALGAHVSGVVGVVQSGTLGALVSGAVGILQSGALSTLVSGVVGVVQSGALAASVSGSINASQSGAWSVQVSGAAGTPVFVATTGSVPVNTGTFPVVVVTAALANPVTVAITGALSAVFSGTQAVTSTVANPVFISGTVHVDNPGGGGGGGAVTQGGPWSVQVSSTTGAPVWVATTGNLPVTISGALSAVFSGTQAVTATQASPVWVTGTVTAQGGSGGGTVTQGGAWGTAASGVVGIVQSGALGTAVSGVVGVAQSGGFTVQVSGVAGSPIWVTGAVGSPVWVALTGALAGHPVTQGGAWGTAVSGVVGITQSGALGTAVSGVVGVVPSGAWSVQVSGTAAAPVFVATTGSVPTKEVRAGTAALTNVASSLSNQTLLAANANRLGAAIYNDSTANLFVKLGATASSTSFTLKMAAGGYYEVPFQYTGQIDGLWDAANGAARVTEVT